MLVSSNKHNKLAKDWLRNNQYPYEDNQSLRKSKNTYPSGALFAIETPVINSYEILEKTIFWLGHYNIKCDRFNETRGAFLLSDSEIEDMLGLCQAKSVGILFSLSPRPEYDTKAAFYRSPFGLEQCRKLNNLDAITYCLEEALRLAELGCRGLIVYDIGVLKLLSEMREQGDLPKEMYFKASSHCMASNPFIAQTLQNNGANSITTIHDASLVMLQAMRKLCPDLMLDVPIDTYTDKGGFIRFAELSNIVSVAAPVVLKVGASAQSNPYDTVNEAIIKNRVRMINTTQQHLYRVFSPEQQLSQTSSHSCIPVNKHCRAVAQAYG